MEPMTRRLLCVLSRMSPRPLLVVLAFTLFVAACGKQQNAAPAASAASELDELGAGQSRVDEARVRNR